MRDERSRKPKLSQIPPCGHRRCQCTWGRHRGVLMFHGKMASLRGVPCMCSTYACWCISAGVDESLVQHGPKEEDIQGAEE